MQGERASGQGPNLIERDRTASSGSVSRACGVRSRMGMASSARSLFQIREALDGASAPLQPDRNGPPRCRLVVFSVGRGLRGPYSSGLVIGKAELIDAPRMDA